MARVHYNNINILEDDPLRDYGFASAHPSLFEHPNRPFVAFFR